MDDLSKIIGENGCIFIDGAVTDQNIYQIHVLEDATFTVLEEAVNEDSAGIDVMTDINLTGKTIPAGAILTPRAAIFKTITVTSGKLMGYKLN